MARTIPTVAVTAQGGSGTSLATASWGPVNGRLYIAWVASKKGAVAETPTLTGNSSTWTNFATVQAANAGGTRVRLTGFWMLADGSTTSGATTADWGGGTQAQRTIAIEEWSDGAAVGWDATNFSDTNVTSITVTSAAYQDTESGVSMSACLDTSSGGWTQGTDMTLLGSALIGSGSFAHHREYRTQNKTNPAISWTNSRIVAAIAVEIEAPTGGDTDITVTSRAYTLTVPSPTVVTEGEQVARPLVDIDPGDWEPVPEEPTFVALADNVDEVSPDDADYIISPPAPADTRPCELLLAPLVPPASTTAGGTLRIRLRLE